MADDETIDDPPEIVNPHPGVEDGTEVVAPSGETERIVHDLDDDGNVVGWHKETV